MSRTVRYCLIVLLALAGAAVPATAAAAPAAPSAAAACSTQWGSLPEAVPAQGSAPVTSARAGRHQCWDRVVFALAGPAAGYDVRYVNEVVQDGSGAVVPVPGDARLQVRLHHPARDENGNTTLVPPVAIGGSMAGVGGFETLRSVIYAGSFEGDTTIGVGTRSRLPFRVFILNGPEAGSRIVVDVAHSW